MKFVPNAVTRVAARQLLKTQKNAPGLLFAVGVIGVVATTVLACKATLQIEEVLENTQKDLVNIDEIEENRSKGMIYSERHIQREKMHVYIRTARELANLYWPAVLVGTVSIAALTKSHSILNKRNAGLTAAYAAIDRAFSDYRLRVKEELGEERERELYYPLEKCEIDVVDPETGKTTKKEILTHKKSIYARLFDRNSNSWNQNPDYNIAFLRAQQSWATDRLRGHGHLFLNEVYDALGLERSTPGAVVGWVLGQGNEYVDFGIFNEPTSPEVIDFFMGHEGGVWLDFNVSGVIYDKI